jgi:hypothetical protein
MEKYLKIQENHHFCCCWKQPLPTANTAIIAITISSFISSALRMVAWTKYLERHQTLNVGFS